MVQTIERAPYKSQRLHNNRSKCYQLFAEREVHLDVPIILAEAVLKLLAYSFQ